MAETIDIFHDLDPDINHFQDANLTESKYYSVQEFNHNFKPNSSNLSVFHLNIRSMNQNGDDLNTFLSNLSINFDVICISETWFNDSSLPGYYFPNHNGYHSYRPGNGRGGGVSIYVSKKFKVQHLNLISENSELIECIFVKISNSDKSVIVGCCYRPHSSNVSNFSSLIEQKLNGFDFSRVNCVLCGDFNADFFKYSEDNNIAIFYDGMHSEGLIPTITKPTRSINSTYSLIDNIFISLPFNYSSGIFKADLSDHFPIFVMLESFFSDRQNQCQNISYRLSSEVRISNLVNAFSSLDFNSVVEEEDCDLALRKLDKIIMDLYNTHCPIKHKIVSYKEKTKPWISLQIKQNMKTRQNYFRLYRRGLMSSGEYHRFRNFVTGQIRSARDDFYAKLFDKFKNDAKQTWKAINDLIKGNDSHSSSSIIDHLNVGGSFIRENKDISDALNLHFSTIGERISNSNNSSFDDHLRFVMHKSTPNSFYFRPISTQNIKEAIDKLNNKSCSIDSYPNKIFKALKTEISPIMAKIYNKSISTQNFPDFFKVARVIPLFKSGSRSEVGNYRPISILSPFSKIFERIVFNQLLTYLDKFKIFTNSQFGFRTKRSTAQAIIDNVHHIQNNIDRGNIAVSIFLDFQKAFDCVNHSILLSKLSVYGIRGLPQQWFRSFLADRKQFTLANGINSSIRTVNCGVPQGSILSPLLFLLFINDFPDCSNFFKFTLFADDSTLTCTIDKSTYNSANFVVDGELEKVYSWLKANQLQLNTSKSTYLVFSGRKAFSLPSIHLNGVALNQSENTKFLGLIVDKNLKFSTHITQIKAKLSKSVGIIHKLKHILPYPALLTIYQSLVVPYISYAIEIWHGAPKYLINQIFILQKKAIRAINLLPYNSHTNNYFKEAKLLKLEELFKSYSCSHIYQAMHSENHFLRAHLKTHHEISNLNTRNSSNLMLPLCKKAQTKAGFMFTAIKEWNTLPSNVKCAKTIFSFKSKIKNYYLSQY